MLKYCNEMIPNNRLSTKPYNPHIVVPEKAERLNEHVG